MSRRHEAYRRWIELSPSRHVAILAVLVLAATAVLTGGF